MRGARCLDISSVEAKFLWRLNEINGAVKRFFLFHCHFGVTSSSLK